MGSLFALVLAICYKQFSWKMLYDSLVDTAKTLSLIHILLPDSVWYHGLCRRRSNCANSAEAGQRKAGGRLAAGFAGSVLQAHGLLPENTRIHLLELRRNKREKLHLVEHLGLQIDAGRNLRQHQSLPRQTEDVYKRQT